MIYLCSFVKGDARHLPSNPQLWNVTQYTQGISLTTSFISIGSTNDSIQSYPKPLDSLREDDLNEDGSLQPGLICGALGRQSSLYPDRALQGQYLCSHLEAYKK